MEKCPHFGGFLLLLKPSWKKWLRRVRGPSRIVGGGYTCWGEGFRRDEAMEIQPTFCR